MTSQKPEYLFQGFDYLGSLKGQLGDFRSITTLAHELIQNADDAKDDAGKLAATRITFDIRDDALIVSNDAVFREADFCRMQKVASYSKRSESGDPTTGAFGVGFIAVYQFTDRPEIHSAGRRWTLRPEALEHQRIEQYRNPSITKDMGTAFRLPWAFEKSEVREKLGVPQVDRNDIDSFVEELKNSLPKALLFLKKLNTIELLRSGDPVMRVKRVACSNTTRVCVDGVSQNWRIIKGDFCREASQLKDQFPGYIEGNRRDHVRVAIPDSLLDEDEDLLFATLPTEQSTGLPFHINADFFPQRDRKSIIFEDTRTHDYKSQWNRAAIQAAAAAAAVGDNLLALREDMFRDDAPTFWGILDRLQRIHREHGDDARIPLGAFWQKLSPSLPNLPVVYTESGKWVTPDQARIPTVDEEKEVVSAFGALGIETVHLDLLQYCNILTNIGVGELRIKDIHTALKNMDMVGRILSDNPLPVGTLELLWKGIHGILERSARQREAVASLKQCALAPGLDGRLWPCGLVYQAGERIRKLFAPLVSRNTASFLAVEGIPLLQRLCSQFGPRSAIKELEHPEAQWRNGSFDPAALLRWFDTRNRKTRLGEDLRQRLAQLPVFPSEGGHLRPGSLVYHADAYTRELFAPLMGHDTAPFLAARVMDIPLLGELCPQFTPGSAIENLERLDSEDFQAQWRAGSFNPATLLHWFDKRELTEGLRERLSRLPIFPSAKNLHTLEYLRLPGRFDDPIDVAVLFDMKQLKGLTDFLESLGAQKLDFIGYARDYIPGAFAADGDVSQKGKRELLDILAERIGEIKKHDHDREVKGKLASVYIVECSDGKFRQPGSVYFRNEEVEAILGDHISYARLPGNSQIRADLYHWLGVQTQPRAEDIVRVIDKLIAQPPIQGAGKEIARVLVAVWRVWDGLDNVNLLCERLSTRQIVECTDGVFRRPGEVYLLIEEVKAALGDHVSYALLPKKSDGRSSLYCLLDIKDRPDVKDVLNVVYELSAGPPDFKTSRQMVSILKIVGKDWKRLHLRDQARYTPLMREAWLPGKLPRWYRPNELYAVRNKRLFESQASFLDLPEGSRQEISEFIQYLGVNLNTPPYHVVSHLLWCSQHNRVHPGDIYRWLNNNTQPSDLVRLRHQECLRVGGKYVRPDRVFLERHPFGRFRVWLGDDFRKYPNLIEALDIREAPDNSDAFQVLKDISEEMGDRALSAEDKSVVDECWDMLAESLQNGEFNAEDMRSKLHDTKCILNHQDILQSPSQMFFEDRPGLVEKFPEQLGDKSIPRPGRVQKAMEAAGVRAISNVVRGIVDVPANHQEDTELKKRVMEREPLILTISDETEDNRGIPLGEIHFFRADELRVKWYIDTDYDYSTSSEPVSAYLDSGKKSIYSTLGSNDSPPWPDIAREMAQVVAPGEEIGRISPGLKTILEANTYEAALADSSALGIVPTEEREKLERAEPVAESLDEASPSDDDQEPPTSPQDDPISSGVADEIRQDDRDVPALPLSSDAPDPAMPARPAAPDPRRDGLDDRHHERPPVHETPQREIVEPPERDTPLHDTPVERGGGDIKPAIRRRRSFRDDSGTRDTGKTAGSVPVLGPRTPRGGGRRRFISYVEVHPNEREPDPDGLTDPARKELEASAIAFILKQEWRERWERPHGEPEGFDLKKVDDNGVISLCEVKAMTGAWDNRPVGVSRKQFETAQKCGEAYWLYVVEHAGTASARIRRIQDPAGKARTFMFDHGWREVAV